MQEPSNHPMLTPSEIMEYLYCPRFTYFLNVLRIPQHEERRTKVMMGREIHKKRASQNISYCRKKIPVQSKDINVYLADEEVGVRGIVDEVLLLADDSLAPLDYKFATYKGVVFQTYSIQLTLYALLIEAQYKKTVNHGYLAYVRGTRHVETIEVHKYKEKTKKIISNVWHIIRDEIYPKGTTDKRKCVDCTYKNICTL